jgi:hypothetical protein
MTGAVDLDPAAVSRRLRRVSELADLAPARRLDAKTGLAPEGVGQRLRLVAELSELCVRLAAAGRGVDRTTRETP